MSMLNRTRGRATTLGRNVRRVTLGAIGLRLVVFAAGLAALAVAGPAPWWGSPGIMLMAVLLALGAAIVPGTWFPLLVELAAVGGWMARTLGFEAPVTWVSVTGLAVTLYVHHVACAWASVVPLSTVLEPVVWRRWAMRVLVVLGVTTVASAVALWGAARVGDAPAASVLVPVLGVLAVIGVAALVAHLVHRR